MASKAELPQRTYPEINENRRRLLDDAYFCFPEYIYCDPDKFNWETPAGRINIFDLFYLEGCHYVELLSDSAATHRKPDFMKLTPQGADLMEIPGKLDEKFPLDQNKRD
jgi:hypothetical protein